MEWVKDRSRRRGGGVGVGGIASKQTYREREVEEKWLMEVPEDTVEEEEGEEEKGERKGRNSVKNGCGLTEKSGTIGKEEDVE